MHLVYKSMLKYGTVRQSPMVRSPYIVASDISYEDTIECRITSDHTPDDQQRPYCYELQHHRTPLCII